MTIWLFTLMYLTFMTLYFVNSDILNEAQCKSVEDIYNLLTKRIILNSKEAYIPTTK